MNEKKLLSIEDAENLSIDAVQNYYKEYISKSQVDLQEHRELETN